MDAITTFINIRLEHIMDEVDLKYLYTDSNKMRNI